MKFPTWAPLAVLGGILLSIKKGSSGSNGAGGAADFVEAIDVSHNNGPLNYVALAMSGVKAVWIKATEGRDWRDPMAAKHASGALAAGLAIGYYHYGTPQTDYDANDARLEAQHFLSTVAGLPSPSLPHVLDIEEHWPAPVSVAARRQWVNSFLNELRPYLAGRKPIVYMSAGFYPVIGSQPFDATLWVADYTGKVNHMPGWTNWQIHQYTGTGLDRNRIRTAYARSLGIV